MVGKDSFFFILAAIDVIFIAIFYIMLSLIIKLGPDETPSEKWQRVERIIEKYHIMKFVYVAAAVLIIQVDLKIVGDILTNGEEVALKFVKINLLLVANLIGVIALFIDKIALFQRKKEIGV